MATKKYLSLERLTEYDALIKGEISAGDDAVKSHIDTELAKKADKEHTHDDLYYTETEVDNLIAGVNTSISKIESGEVTVKKAEEANHATSADTATSASDAEKLGGQTPDYYAKASDIPTGALASKDIVSESDLDSALATKVNAAAEGNHSHSNKSVLDGITSEKVTAWDSSLDDAKEYADTELAKKADKEHNHDSAYDTKGAASSALTEAKSYTDTKTEGMATTAVVDNKISAHNVATDAHNDIRDLVSELSTKVSNFLDVDDTTTDQLSEVLELIENNKGDLESLTSGKVNVSDIVNNLTTNSESKVLSAAQGVALKALIDELQLALDGKSEDGHTHSWNDLNNKPFGETMEYLYHDETISTSFWEKINEYAQKTSDEYDTTQLPKLKTDDKVRVLFDGVEYRCNVKEYYDSLTGTEFYIGNFSIFQTTNGENTGEPFYLITSEMNKSDRFTIFVNPQVTDITVPHTLQVYYIGESLIDEKYIPDTISRLGHTHEQYSEVSHTHEQYSEIGHVHTQYAATGHTHILSEIKDVTSFTQGGQISILSRSSIASSGALAGTFNTEWLSNTNNYNKPITVILSGVEYNATNDNGGIMIKDANGNNWFQVRYIGGAARVLGASGTPTPSSGTIEAYYYSDMVIKISETSIDDAIARTEYVDAQLASKAPATHSHTISNITNLSATLASCATKEDLINHTSNGVLHVTGGDKAEWNQAYSHSTSEHAPVDAQANVIESIKVNGEVQTITDKCVDITVPDAYTKEEVDTALSGKSDNEHGHAISDITDLQTTLNNAASAISTNTSSIETHTSRIEALEGKVGEGFEEISVADIQALFA